MKSRPHVVAPCFAADYGISFATASQVQALQWPDIAIRPQAEPRMLSTYLLRRRAEPSEQMTRFLKRARQAFAPSRRRHTDAGHALPAVPPRRAVRADEAVHRTSEIDGRGRGP